MKKTILFLLVVVLAVGLMSSVALAAPGRWSTIGNTNAPNNGEWDSSEVPHYGFSTTTNQCRVCHSVHDANADSYRLLRNNSRATECDICHNMAGALTAKQPYRRGYGVEDFDVQGEHTIGSTVIPDKTGVFGIDSQIAADGLACGNCHSVHGANVINGDRWDDGLLNSSSAVKSRILKNDPPANSSDVNAGFAGPGGVAVTDRWTLRTSFCGSCHNKNPNQDDSGAADSRAGTAYSSGVGNKTSHITGNASDGTLEVYGVATKVGKFTTVDAVASRTGWRADQDTAGGCRSCHQGQDAGNTLGNSNSAWPHQTKGAKLLADHITGDVVDEAAALTNADRVIADMDRVCLDCHSENRIGGGAAGVGITF